MCHFTWWVAPPVSSCPTSPGSKLWEVLSPHLPVFIFPVRVSSVFANSIGSPLPDTVTFVQGLEPKLRKLDHYAEEGPFWVALWERPRTIQIAPLSVRHRRGDT